MRYIVIFGITLLISLLLIFYPKNYLMKFKKNINIDYNSITNEELWKYELNNNCIKFSTYSNNKWKFISNKNGRCELIFYYDKNNEKYKYKIIYEFLVKDDLIIWKSGQAFGLLDYPNPY